MYNYCTYILLLLRCYREESGIYSKRLGYQITMKKVAQLQEKIEGWEVNQIRPFCVCSQYLLVCVCICVFVCV